MAERNARRDSVGIGVGVGAMYIVYPQSTIRIDVCKYKQSTQQTKRKEQLVGKSIFTLRALFLFRQVCQNDLCTCAVYTEAKYWQMYGRMNQCFIPSRFTVCSGCWM